MLRQLSLTPLWLIEVFSWAKSFQANPVIGSKLLNTLGLHVARVIVAHGLFVFRQRLLWRLADSKDRRAFASQGYLLKHDFLPQSQFLALKREAETYQGALRDEVEGDTLAQRVYLTRQALLGLPQCTALTEHRGLLRLLRYCSSKNRIPFFFLENLQQGHLKRGSRDSQKDLHCDTFHPCIKAWLYLDPAELHNGPFEFIPGSHRLTWGRVRWEYRQSLEASLRGKLRDPARYWDGSFRVGDADLAEMGLTQPIAMSVPANTLLIANVRGFHRRGEATGQSPRLSVWMQSRDNPFNPLFTPFPKLTARVFEWVWIRHLAREFPRKEAEGLWKGRTGQFVRHPNVP